MGDADKILRLLINKDQQAYQQNIGDPSVFLRVFDPESEEDEVGKALEANDASGSEQRMDANAEAYQQKSNELNLFEEMFGVNDGDYDAPKAEATAPIEVKRHAPYSLFPSLWRYVNRALEAVAERMEQSDERLDLKPFDEQERLEISPRAIYSGATSAIPKNSDPPKANGWCSPPKWQHCSGPWSKRAAKTMPAPSWNSSGICIQWWIGSPIAARSPSPAIAPRCSTSQKGWILVRR